MKKLIIAMLLLVSFSSCDIQGLEDRIEALEEANAPFDEYLVTIDCPEDTYYLEIISPGVHLSEQRENTTWYKWQQKGSPQLYLCVTNFLAPKTKGAQLTVTLYKNNIMQVCKVATILDTAQTQVIIEGSY